MHIQMTGHRIELTEAMQAYVQDKFQKLDHYLSHLDEDLRLGHVTVRHIEGPTVKVNFDMMLPGKHHIYKSEEHTDFYAAVDLLLGVIEKELRQIKEKGSHTL